MFGADVLLRWALRDEKGEAIWPRHPFGACGVAGCAVVRVNFPIFYASVKIPRRFFAPDTFKLMNKDMDGKRTA